MTSTTKLQNLFHLIVGSFQRNNPILQLVARFEMTIQFMLNYRSNVKLNRFRHSLYMQQLQRMEGFIQSGSPYQVRGEKIDRRF